MSRSYLLTPLPIQNAIHKAQEGWRKVIATAVTLGIPVPAFSSALAFYDGFRSERLPANLIQVSAAEFLISYSSYISYIAETVR